MSMRKSRVCARFSRMVPESWLSSLITAVCDTRRTFTDMPRNAVPALSIRSRTAPKSAAGMDQAGALNTRPTIAMAGRFIWGGRLGLGEDHVALGFPVRIRNGLDAGHR